MEADRKVALLRGEIGRQLTPLITGDYVLWGLPYYTNIGDTLIWEGERELLREIPHKCLGVCAWNDYRKICLSANTIILITGGGYMGDIWRKAWQQVLNVLSWYPNNPVVILPNTVHYNDPDVMEADIRFFSSHGNLTVCMRDLPSYKWAKEKLACRVLLVPDMAFCMNTSRLRRHMPPIGERSLLLKRTDKELAPDDIRIEDSNLDIRDWPTMDRKMAFRARVCCKIFSGLSSRKGTWLEPPLRLIGNVLADKVFRPYMIGEGVSFVSRYRRVYTTRLHVMILRTLLGQSVEYIDNSYGKLGAFYDTWLADADNVKPYGK